MTVKGLVFFKIKSALLAQVWLLKQVTLRQFSLISDVWCGFNKLKKIRCSQKGLKFQSRNVFKLSGDALWKVRALENED